MRSRYAAFAKKEVAYLWRTLHPDHEDRALSEAAVQRSLRDACATHRYMGLEVLDHSSPDASGVARVLFAAKVFLRGKDLSFIELSTFARDGVGWRYLAGDAIARSAVSAPSTLTIASFPNGPGGIKTEP